MHHCVMQFYHRVTHHRIVLSIFYNYFTFRFDPAVLVKKKIKEEGITSTYLSGTRTQVPAAFLVLHKIFICMLHSQKILLSQKLNNVYFFLLSDDGAVECWGYTGTDGHWVWGRGTGPICDQKQEKKWPGATGSSYSSPSILSNSSIMFAPLPDSPTDGQGVSLLSDTGNAVVRCLQGPHGEGSTFSSNLLRSSMNPTFKHCILMDLISKTGISLIEPV